MQETKIANKSRKQGLLFQVFTLDVFVNLMKCLNRIIPVLYKYKDIFILEFIYVLQVVK